MSQLPRHSRLASQGVGLCLAAALLVPAPPARAAQAGGPPSWVPIGPEGGEIFALAAASGGVVYAGTASGGVVRSDDGGRHWGLPGRGLPPAFLVTALAVVPGRPEIVYAGGDQFGPYLSTDGGGSWLPATAGFEISNGEPEVQAMAATADGSAVYAVSAFGRLYKTQVGRRSWRRLVLPAMAGSITADPPGGGRGFWLSTDGGDRWRPSSHSLFAQSLVSMRIGSAGSSSFLYASVLTFPPEPLYLFRRETGGAFRVVGGSGNAVVGVDPVRPEIVYASLYDSDFHGLWKSSDGGLTWSALDFPQDGRIDVFKIDSSSPSTLYASGAWSDSGGALCQLGKSTDGGKTWACLSFSLDASVLLIDPARPSNLYLVSSGGQLYASRDGGSAWKPAARGLPPDQPVSILALDPSHSRRLYAAVQVSDQTAAVYVSDDGAGSWTRLARGLTGPITSLAVDPHQPRTLYAGVIEQRDGRDQADGSAGREEDGQSRDAAGPPGRCRTAHGSEPPLSAPGRRRRLPLPPTDARRAPPRAPRCDAAGAGRRCSGASAIAPRRLRPTPATLRSAAGRGAGGRGSRCGRRARPPALRR
jgi:photosystem II stability/assembly factor-like uncharacterized protein